MEPLTLDEIRALPPVIDLPTAARAFKIGRTLAYNLARTGGFPCPIQRYGRMYRVLTVDVRDALGISDDPPPTTSARELVVVEGCAGSKGVSIGHDQVEPEVR